MFLRPHENTLSILILTFWIFQVREDDRAEVSRLVLVGEVVVWDSWVRVVVDLSHVLDVGRILSHAGYPHHPAHHGVLDLLLLLHVVLQGLAGLLRQLLGGLVRLRLPVEDLQRNHDVKIFSVGSDDGGAFNLEYRTA